MGVMASPVWGDGCVLASANTGNVTSLICALMKFDYNAADNETRC